MAARRVKLLFDENFSHVQVKFVRSESGLGEIIHSRTSGFDGVQDKLWIPKATEAGFVIVSWDRNEKTRGYTVADLKAMGVRMILLGGWWDHDNVWQKAKWLVRYIEKLWTIASRMKDGTVLLLETRQCRVKEL